MHGIQRIYRSAFGHAKGCAKGPAFNNLAYKRKTRISEGTTFEVSARILTFGWNKDRIKNTTNPLDPALKGKLGEQQLRLYSGALPMQQALISSQDSVIVSGQPLIDNIKKRAPVGWGLSPKMRPCFAFYVQILKSAPRPNSAQVPANFMVMQRRQGAVVRMAASALPSVPGAIAYIDSVP